MHYMKATIGIETSYREILKTLISSGNKRCVRGTSSIELSPFILTTSCPLQNLLSNESRNINKAYAIIEFLWILSGRSDLEMLQPYNGNIEKFANNGLSFTGAYGPKLIQQLSYIIDKLIFDPNTRQAVVSIWERRPSIDKDIPCTIAMQFIKSGNELDLIVTMRSNDVWLGLPYDFFTFTMILNYVALKVNLKVGAYTHQVGSLHIYDQHLEKAKKAIFHNDEKVFFKDLINIQAFEKDELKLTCFIEQKLRQAFHNKNIDELNNVVCEYTTISEPWKTMLEYVKLHLEKKIKKDVQNK